MRELKNAVQRGLALGTFTPEPNEPSDPPAFASLVSAFEHDYLASLLDRHSGNLSAAAREAKIVRSQFYRLLQRHGFHVPTSR